MEVEVTRTGGFAGLRRAWRADVESQPDKDEWLILIDELPWDDVPLQPSEPDRYTWVIRIAVPGADAPEHTAALPERNLTGDWRRLVDRVREAGTPVERPGT